MNFSTIFKIFTQKLFDIKFRNQQSRGQKNIQICKIFNLITLLKYYGQRFGYCRRRGLLALKFTRITAVEPCTNVQSKPFSPAFGNTLLAVRASVCPLKNCFISHFNFVIAYLLHYFFPSRVA